MNGHATSIPILAIVAILILTDCGGVAQPSAVDSGSSSTTNGIQQRLDAFENGSISLQELTGDKMGCDELIGYYLSHKDEIRPKAKLAISRCYALEEEFRDAARLAQEYVNVYSNDWRGWSILGGCYFFENSFDKSIQAYRNAIRLGQTNSYEPLALAALKLGRMDIVGGIVPDLMALKDAKQTSEEDRLNVISVLLFYSAKTYHKDIFLETLKGESMKDMLKNNKVRLDIESGCQLFEGKDIDKIRLELEAAERNSSLSSTNTPPP